MAAERKKFRLQRSEAGLLVIDIQERLCQAMDPARLEPMVARTCAAIRGAKALGLPIVMTEQYPKGLGHTLPQIASLLPDVRPIEKMSFSCGLEPIRHGLRRPQVLIVGMEAHVCVFQTARDLAETDAVPWILADAVLSRNEEDRQVGLALCRDVGSIISTVESALFDLLGKAGSPEFKLVSQAVK